MEMESKKKSALVFLIVFALICGVDAKFKSFVCENKGAGDDYSCTDGYTPTVMCDDAPAVGNCRFVCAAKCGSLTACVHGSCETCCSATSCAKYTPGTVIYGACMESCKGTCIANTEFCEVINILETVGAGLAIFMLMFNGLKWILLADDPAGRQDAKRGIVYVFVGLAVLVVSFGLVTFLLAGRIVC